MSELIGKLKDLGYDIFGIILPGLIAELFFLIWWLALGPNAPGYTLGVLSELTLNRMSQFIQSLTTNTGVGIALPSLIAAYFVGHMLNWIGRSASADDSSIRSSPRRVWSALRFKLLKPRRNYDDTLADLFAAIEKEFRSGGINQLTWAQFFPVAKCYLAKTLPTSLVTTYQTKYTLHRSITVAASVLFWLSVATIVVACVRWAIGSTQVIEVGVLVSIAIASLAVIWGFSDSYAYNWKLFGSTIVTESYSQLFSPPKHETEH